LGFLGHFFTFIRMKKLFLCSFLLLFFSSVEAQTGGISCNVDFTNDFQCATFQLKLTKADTSFHFQMVNSGDTLSNIPTGLYKAVFLSCDSAYSYHQNIEIVSGKIRSFYYKNTAAIDTYRPVYSPYDDDYYYNYYDSLYNPVYFNIGLRFSRGIDYQGLNPNLLNNFTFDYTFGHDFLLTKPVAFGYEIGFGYTQANYTTDDFLIPSVSYEKQRFTTFDFSFALLTSLYIKDGRLLSLGARYRLPYFARWARVTGDEKMSTKGLHRFNDFSVFAQLGYDWGYLFAEYRFDQILRAPLGDLPNLALGVRLNVTEEW